MSQLVRKLVLRCVLPGTVMFGLMACTPGPSIPLSEPTTNPIQSTQSTDMHSQDVSETSLPKRAQGLAVNGYEYITTATGTNFSATVADSADLDVVCDSPGEVVFQIGSSSKSNLYSIACDKKPHNITVAIDKGDNIVTIYAKETFADVKWQISN